jgi:murein L,D-transpeptidase YafK
MLAQVLFLILPLIALAQEPIVETYRLQGIGPIEKMLDKELADTEHWYEVFKNHDIVYGFFDRETDLLLCSKRDKELQLYHANSHFELVQKAPIVIGRLPGDKQKEGDLRTPIGVYRIVARKEHPGPEYGPVAFVTNYPNRYDRILGKDGHGIWLHGFPEGCDDKNATKGCIALDNSSLLQLDRQLNYKKALLIISENPLKKVSKNELARLLAFIYGWRYAWKYNDFSAYLDHYAKTLVFKSRYDYRYFKSYKRSVFKANAGRKKVLRFSNLQVVPYPNAAGKRLWYVSFWEDYQSGAYQYHGRKVVWVQHMPDGQFKIVVE